MNDGEALHIPEGPPKENPYGRHQAELRALKELVTAMRKERAGLGYSLEENPKPAHAFSTLAKLIEAKQLTTPVPSKLYSHLYDRKKEVVVEPQSNYVAFNPAGLPGMGLGGPAPAPPPLTPAPAAAHTPAPAAPASNYIQFNPAMLAAATTAIAHTNGKPSNYESFAAALDLKKPAVGAVGGPAVSTPPEPPKPNAYERFGTGGEGGFDIEAVLKAQTAAATAPTAPTAPPSNYQTFDPSTMTAKK